MACACCFDSGGVRIESIHACRPRYLVGRSAQHFHRQTRAFFLGTKVQIEQMTWSSVLIVIALVVAAIALGVYRRKTLARDGMTLILVWFIVPLIAYFVVLQKSPQF